MSDVMPKKNRVTLQAVRLGMAAATQKYSLSGRKKDLKPITLRRADYDRQKAGQ